MEEVSIQPLQTAEIQEAASIAARAMAPTPFPMAISRDREAGERFMKSVFKIVFGHLPGQVLAAKEGKHMVGVIRMVEWPSCQMTLLQAMRLLPTMLSTGLRTGSRGMKGKGTWSKYDPKEPHWHLDPLAVVPERQGHGIGTRLLKEFCIHADKTGLPAYLETDRAENVRLYERFGFKTTMESTVIGVKCWFMWRRPKAN